MINGIAYVVAIGFSATAAAVDARGTRRRLLERETKEMQLRCGRHEPSRRRRNNFIQAPTAAAMTTMTVWNARRNRID